MRDETTGEGGTVSDHAETHRVEVESASIRLNGWEFVQKSRLDRADAERDGLRARVEQLEAALRFYADEDDWDSDGYPTMKLADDKGAVARATLSGLGDSACTHPEVSEWGYCQVCTQAVSRSGLGDAG